MVVIKCRIISKPQVGTRPIYRIRNNDKSSNIPGPLIRGKSGGRLKYVYGRCGYLLAYNVFRKEISVDAVFQCTNCHKYNEAYCRGQTSNIAP